MKKAWKYATNQFDYATRQSKKRMHLMAAHHWSKLGEHKEDPVILELFNRFAGVFETYAVKYGLWLEAKGVYKGETERFEMLLRSLSAQKVLEWNVKVQNVFLEKTPAYKAIFPKKRGPFQTGSRDNRVNAVRALASKLIEYDDLKEVQQEVDQFACAIESCRAAQQEIESTMELHYRELEDLRQQTARVMYANLGRLMEHFADDPQQIEFFFDLDLIRQSGKEEEEVTAIPTKG